MLWGDLLWPAPCLFLQPRPPARLHCPHTGLRTAPATLAPCCTGKRSEDSRSLSAHPAPRAVAGTWRGRNDPLRPPSRLPPPSLSPSSPPSSSPMPSAPPRHRRPRHPQPALPRGSLWPFAVLLGSSRVGTHFKALGNLVCSVIQPHFTNEKMRHAEVSPACPRLVTGLGRDGTRILTRANLSVCRVQF